LGWSFVIASSHKVVQDRELRTSKPMGQHFFKRGICKLIDDPDFSE
jgi:hypothetical protein